jgi:hypothetical protein
LRWLNANFGITVRIRVIKRKNHSFQLVIEGRDLDVVLFGIFRVADRPTGDAFEVSFDPPPIAHTRTPFIAAFMPLDP